MPNYELATDEELLYEGRSGDELAQRTLDMRYFQRNENSIRIVAPDLLRYYSLCDLASVAFQCYIDCLIHYKFGPSSFRSFYHLCLSHELSKVRRDIYDPRKRAMSMDENTRNGQDLTYHDVIPSNDIYDSPRKYVDYFEEVYELNLAPKAITGETLVVARMRLDGASFQEIAERLKLPIRKVYYRYKVFENEVKKLINKVNASKS